MAQQLLRNLLDQQTNAGHISNYEYVYLQILIALVEELSGCGENLLEISKSLDLVANSMPS